MSTLTAPAPVIAGVRSAPAVATRRTTLGFIATRRVVEIILTAILGVGGALVMVGDFLADPRIAARHTEVEETP